MELTEKIRNRLSSTSWFHATTRSQYLNILHEGVVANKNRYKERDFGYGFYLTANTKMAENFAKNVLSYDLDTDTDSLVIIEFELNPLEWFTSEQYNCAVFPAYDDAFAEFVFMNRYNGSTGIQCHEYDAVYGVMSDGNPMSLVASYRSGDIGMDEVIAGLKKGISTKQLSLHTQALCDSIILKGVYEYNPETDERKELD